MNKPEIESTSRRKAVKTIVGGVTALAAYNMMPVKWGTPVIEQIFLPAHAATSGECSEDAIVGTWIVFVAGIEESQFTLNTGGSYIDVDGDTGTWTLSNNTVTITTDDFSAVGTLSDCSSMTGTSSDGDPFTATKQ
ncbi:MAG: hypothetical protein ACI8ZB_004897 [Desulforhopalus sp.]|jgi:hypothetical protein